MIVRTYGRRKGTVRGCSDSAFDDVVSDGFGESLSQDSPRDVYDFGFSSQDSCHWAFDSEPYGSNSSQELKELAVLPPRKPAVGGNSEDFRKSKKPRSGKNGEIAVLPPKKLKPKATKSMPMGPTTPTVTAAATLMETQEFGEMMEHVDEVNFALDGLRKGQPVRIRRASLLSLLSICGNAQQRRLLRAHGMTKKIIDAVLGLSFDDTTSNLAAAALLYILASDGQDDHILDSPSCINFLIKLLKPLTSDKTKIKGPTIGTKLLALHRNENFQGAIKGTDSTSSAVMLKVQEILFSVKELKSKDGNYSVMDKSKLSAKWIALLTMEKACLSTVTLEDTSGTIQNSRSFFKERFRELGGLDAVFEVVRNCHSIMEGWLEQSSPSKLELKDNMDAESLVLLLKCLKIMENATFLSTDNQCHLLGMKANSDYHGSSLSFTRLIINVIKILSGVSLLENSTRNSNDEKLINISSGTSHASEMPLVVCNEVDSNEIVSIDSSIECYSIKSTSSKHSFHVSQDSQRSCSGQSRLPTSSSETATTSLFDTCLLKMRIDSSTSGSCSGRSRSSYGGTDNNGSGINFSLGKRPKVTDHVRSACEEDSLDPFAFDEDDFEPSKWDLLHGRQHVSQNSKEAVKEYDNRCQSLMAVTKQESSSLENYHSDEVSCSSVVDEDKSYLLADCLLTAVKVLMNISNDNPMGCQQIAAYGGLEAVSSLIGVHFPLFSSSLLPFSERNRNNFSSKSTIEVDHQNDMNLTDQELDFLVAILGLLVNLVEKDGCNRSRLAAASISLRNLEGLEVENRGDLIPLLCSVFLANQGAGEAAEEGNHWDDEVAVLQGEKEAEKMIVEAYSALLLAFLSTESKHIRDAIAECLPDQNLRILVPVLERFVEFHSTLNMITPETHKTVLEVIESCRAQ